MCRQDKQQCYDTRRPVQFAPAPAAPWLTQLRVLDMDALILQQTATLPALTHLTCDLPHGQTLQAEKFPALQQLILCGHLCKNTFQRLHECKVKGAS